MRVITIVGMLLFLGAAGCERSSENAGQATKPPVTDATKLKDGGGHGVEVIELGNAAIGHFSVRASRDKGAIKPGGDAPIDVWLTGSSDKVIAVRFWIGTQDAKGSAKAKADIEDPKEPNHWHTHAEVPNPLPPESKLWVEIETENGQKTNSSFDLRM